MAKIIEFSKNKTKDYDPIAGLRNEGGEKIIAGYFNEDDDFVSYVGSDVSYMEMLYIIDSLKRRMNYMIENNEF